jgi:hypothetical protein
MVGRVGSELGNDPLFVIAAMMPLVRLMKAAMRVGRLSDTMALFTFLIFAVMISPPRLGDPMPPLRGVGPRSACGQQAFPVALLWFLENHL